MSLIQLGTNLWVNPNDIRAVNIHGGDKGSTEPGHYYVHVGMGEWTASYESDWPMDQVIDRLRRNRIMIDDEPGSELALHDPRHDVNVATGEEDMYR